MASVCVHVSKHLREIDLEAEEQKFNGAKLNQAPVL